MEFLDWLGEYTVSRKYTCIHTQVFFFFQFMIYMKCHILKRQKQEKDDHSVLAAITAVSTNTEVLTGQESCSRCPGPCSPALWFS